MRPAPRHPVTQHLHPTPVSLAPDPKAQGSRPLPGQRGQNTHTWQGWSGSPGEQVPVKGQASMHTEELGPLPAAPKVLPRPGQRQRQRVTRQVPQRWRHRQGCPHAPSGEVLEPTDQGERGQQARAPAGSASSVAAPAASSPSPHAGPSRKTGQRVGGGPSSLGWVLTLRHACLPSMEGVTSSEPWGGRNAVGRSGGTWCRRHPRLSRWCQNLRLGPAPHLPRPQPPPPLLSPGSARGRQALSQARVGPVQLTWQGKKEGWGGQRPASYLQPAQ